MQQSVAKVTPNVIQTFHDPLLWVDIETTGLGRRGDGTNDGGAGDDVILEFAAFMTDGAMTKRVQGPTTAVHHELETLHGMSLWCKNMFGVREAFVSLKNAEFDVDDFYFHEERNMLRVCDESEMSVREESRDVSHTIGSGQQFALSKFAGLIKIDFVINF